MNVLIIRALGFAAALLMLSACGGGSSGNVSGAPLITASPQSTTLIVGQEGLFDVAADGGTLSFSWEERLASASWIPSAATSTSGSGTSQLRIPAVTIGHNDTLYRAVATNAAGSTASAEALLNVVWGTVDTAEPKPDAFGFGTGSEGFGSADGGSPGGGDGEGAGAGGGLGKTLRSMISVMRTTDGVMLGSALTGATSGLVRIKAGPGAAPVLLTLQGGGAATYYDEGMGTMMPLPASQELHSLVTAFDQHLGVTTLTEAAYRYAINHFILDPAQVTSGAVPLGRTATAAELASLTPAQILLAQEAIRGEINRILPTRYQLASIATLPTPVDVASGPGSITYNRYGIMQAVVGGLAFTAGNFNASLAQPALVMNAQLADDLTDGIINGVSLDGQTVFGPEGAAYDLGNLPFALEAAADAQFAQFGDGTAPRPPVITTQPVSATIFSGTSHTFTVAASGNQPQLPVV